MPLPPAPHWIDPNDLTLLPLAEAKTLPATWYWQPDAWAWERTHVLSCRWQLVAHGAQLSQPGWGLPLDDLGTPAMLVKDRQGTLRAMANVCRHRGGPLLTQAKALSTLQCQYHGWTYDLTGQLHQAPDMPEAHDFPPENRCLPEFQTLSWGGFIWLCLYRNRNAHDLTADLETLGQWTGPLDFTGYRWAHQVRYPIACNWKVYVENYLEGYHIPLVHPELAHQLDTDRYTIHTAGQCSLQSSPLSAEGSLYQNQPAGMAHYLFVFPNTMLNILPGRVQTNRVLPTGPTVCEVVFDYYYADTDNVAQRLAADLESSDLIQQQDIAICQQVQRGVASGTYHHGRLSGKHETAVYHFQTLVRQAYQSALG